MLLPCCLLEEDTGYSSDAPVHQHERHGALQCQVWRLGSKAVALSHLSVPHMEVLVWWVRVVKLRLLKHMLGCCRFDSPRSVRHMMSAERKGSGDSSSSDDPIPVNKFNPAEIRTDGSGTTLKGEHSSFIIEIIDPGQKNAPPATSLEQMHVAPGDDLLDNILNRYRPSHRRVVPSTCNAGCPLLGSCGRLQSADSAA